MRNTLLAGLLLASISAPALAAEPAYDLTEARAKIAKIEMHPDTSYLSAEEKQVVNLLIQAAEKMSDIYLRQNYAENPRVRQTILAMRRADQPLILDMFDLYFGPWDELADGHPFWGTRIKPAGAGFYPEDLTKDQFDAYLAAHPDEKAALTSPYTVVRRDGAKLVAVPYSFKFVWSPLIDGLRLPVFTAWLGRRRGWAVASQLALLAAIFAMGSFSPAREPALSGR